MQEIKDDDQIAKSSFDYVHIKTLPSLINMNVRLFGFVIQNLSKSVVIVKNRKTNIDE